MNAMAQQARKIAIQILNNEARSDNLAWFNRSMNIDHDRKLCFVHNPKCMGTSVKDWLGLRTDNADHRFPTLMVNKKTWEEYRTVVVVRHPIERFVSSFNFHCRSDYSGGYLTQYPDLKEWTMDRYWFQMTEASPYAVAPQWKYTTHLRSEAGPDHLIRMEDPLPALVLLASALGIDPLLPKLNQNPSPKEQPSPLLRNTLERYYRLDLDLFGY